MRINRLLQITAGVLVVGLTLGCQSTQATPDQMDPIPSVIPETAPAPAAAPEIKAEVPADNEFHVARLDDPDEVYDSNGGDLDDWAHAEYDPESVWDEADQQVGAFDDSAADLDEVSEERLAAAALEFEFQVDETAGLRLDDVPEKDQESTATTITIQSPLASGMVTIDGIVAGSTGDEITVEPGTIKISVTAPGYDTQEIELQVQKGANTTRAVELEPLNATVAN